MNLLDYVTPHFRLREFLWSEHCQRVAEFSDQERVKAAQEAAIRHLSGQLELVRAWYEKPIIIKSGMRDRSIQGQLVADGIRSASETDHSYFHPDVWAWGTGAVDIEVVGQPHLNVMRDLTANWMDLQLDYAILYPWGIHLAAPADLVLNIRRKRTTWMQKNTGPGYSPFRVTGDGHAG